MKKSIFLYNSIIFLPIFFLLLTGCGNNFFKKVDTRETPINAQERAKKNIKEGKGMSVGNLLNRRGGTNYEFSSSNPMWRASLEILDFLPFTTVDYSGGIIITDWYADSNSKNNKSLKITIRFLSNEIQSNSIKIIVHKKVCQNINNCFVSESNSKIKEELLKTILAKATTFEQDIKEKDNKKK